MNWKLVYLSEALEDLKSLDGSIRPMVIKGIQKILNNPLLKSEGGYGTPLGNKDNINLTNLLKIKFKKIGIRVVYKLVKTTIEMKVIVISARADNQVYKIAENRKDL